MLDIQLFGIPLWIWALIIIIAIILIVIVFVRFLNDNWLLIAAISCVFFFNKFFKEERERRKEADKNPVSDPKDSKKMGYFHHTISFFEDIFTPISIIGVVVTIITLIPLFLTFLLGTDWFHIMLTQIIGIQLLDTVILLTNAAAIFIYFILALILINWINKILRNSNVHPGEKVFSFAILFGFVCITIGIIILLLNIWYTRRDIAASLFSLTGLIIFVFGLAFIAIISGFIMLGGDITPTKQRISNALSKVFLAGCVIFLIIMLGATVIYPAISSNLNVYNISSDYATFATKNVSFQTIFQSETNNAPLEILIQPNLSEYIKDDVNSEYTNCHWSTNYGYFITLDNNLFVQRQSNNFILLDCPANDTILYWTYDIADYSRNKPPVIISLQIENSNQKSAHDNLDEPIIYNIGNYHRNFTWANQSNLIETNGPIF